MISSVVIHVHDGVALGGDRHVRARAVGFDLHERHVARRVAVVRADGDVVHACGAVLLQPQPRVDIQRLQEHAQLVVAQARHSPAELDYGVDAALAQLDEV